MTMKTYCALGFGNNFFYPLGTDSVPIPSNLLVEEDEDDGDGAGSDNNDNGNGEALTIDDKENAPTTATAEEERPPGAQASLLPINPHASSSTSGNGQKIINTNEDDEEFASASAWLRSHLPSRSGDEHTKYSSDVRPQASCGATHTSFILPKKQTTSNNASSAAPVAASGDAHLVGTIFGHSYHDLAVQPTRLPLRITRISSGRRHVLALTEGASPGGGVVMSWGAGHFGQLGHGPDLTSCLEPRIVERLLPHVVGGNVVEIAAGGLHSCAIVASGSKGNQKAFPNGGEAKDRVIVRETKAFAWGSNRKGQCGVEGGKCATVPEPLPVIMVKRGETSKREGDAAKTDIVDRNVHFEKISLGRLHTVALTAYGEVFTWGSTSMGRCGHSSMDSGRGSDRRFVQQPRHVSALRNVSIEAIAAGAAHTLALSKGGRVFAWGAGGDGQCGQGHAGNLFSPRAVQGLPTASSSSSSSGSTNNSQLESSKKAAAAAKTEEKETKEGGHIPHVNSRVALEVAMEEEALSKALSMSQITNNIPPPEQPKSEKIVSIRASGCYSAAITSQGNVYTWGYGSGAALGHPVPSEGKNRLPMIPIIEGNQYSTTTAAKVYPAGGSDDNKFRDARCFDTDLNVMLPRKVQCTNTLGLRVEDVSLGPGHMVILCSTRDNIMGNGMSSAVAQDGGQSAHNSADDDGKESETDDSNSNENAGEEKQSGASSASAAQGLGSLNNDAAYPGATSSKEENNNASSLLGDAMDIGTVNTFESNDSEKQGQTLSKSEKRRRSAGWMTKIKSSRTSKHGSSKSLHGPESEKKKSFMHMGKMFDVVRRGGEK